MLICCFCQPSYFSLCLFLCRFHEVFFQYHFLAVVLKETCSIKLVLQRNVRSDVIHYLWLKSPNGPDITKQVTKDVNSIVSVYFDNWPKSTKTAPFKVGVTGSQAIRTLMVYRIICFVLLCFVLLCLHLDTSFCTKKTCTTPCRGVTWSFKVWSSEPSAFPSETF